MRKHYSATFKAQIVQEVLRGEKTIVQIGSAHGVHPNLISEWKATALDRFPTLFEKENADRVAEQLAHDRQVSELYEEIGRLTTHVAFLKKNLARAMSRDQHIGLVEREGELPLTIQVELLGVSRSSLYYRPVAPSAEEIQLKHRIDEIYTAHPFYGSRRITAQLTREEFVVNRKAVQRHMREMGIVALGPKPNLSKPNPEHRVSPYLLRGLVAVAPNQVGGIEEVYLAEYDSPRAAHRGLSRYFGGARDGVGPAQSSHADHPDHRSQPDRHPGGDDPGGGPWTKTPFASLSATSWVRPCDPARSSPSTTSACTTIRRSRRSSRSTTVR